MVTTLAPCWYCSGLIRQFHIKKVIVGESRTFRGGIDWLREHGVDVIDMESTASEPYVSSACPFGNWFACQVAKRWRTVFSATWSSGMGAITLSCTSSR
jgi:tRNA(Arg) A34 adenosine deaminase TadA